MTINFLQNLGQGLLFEKDVLGQRFELELGNLQAILHFPNLHIDNISKIPHLVSPPSHTIAEEIVEGRPWGSVVEFNTDESNVIVKKVLIQNIFVECTNSVLTNSQHQIRAIWNAAYEQLSEWLQIISEQDSKNGSHASTKGQVTHYLNNVDGLIKPGALHVEIGAHPLIPGLPLSKEDVEKSLSKVQNQTTPPQVYKFLLRSRIGFHESDFRKSVIDAATAQEILLTSLLRSKLMDGQLDQFALLKLGRRGLGELLQNWQDLGGILPKAQTPKITDLRNKAVHEGYVLTEDEARTYYAVARELITHYVEVD